MKLYSMYFIACLLLVCVMVIMYAVGARVGYEVGFQKGMAYENAFWTE